MFCRGSYRRVYSRRAPRAAAAIPVWQTIIRLLATELSGTTQ